MMVSASSRLRRHRLVAGVQVVHAALAVGVGLGPQLSWELCLVPVYQKPPGGSTRQ